MHLKINLIALILFAVSNLSGQTSFQSAYIIDINNDTIQGLIDNTGEVQNSKICSFKASEESEAVNYLPGEITGYRFANSKFYVSKSVDIDDSIQNVFAECLVKGIASLYYLRSEDYELYFIEKEGSALVALTNEPKEVMINGSKTTVHSNSYIRMLKATFSDCFEIQPSIDNAKLHHRSLSSITCKYNDYVGNGHASITYEQGSRIKVRIGPVIGFSINNFSVKGSEPFESFEFDNSNDPVLGLVLDISSSRLGNHFSFQLGTDFGKSNYTTTYEETSPIYPSTVYYYDVYMQGISMKIYGGAKYNFGRHRVKPNLGGGLMFHKYIQPDFWYELETHEGDIITTEEWHGEPVGNLLFGAYIQAGVDMDISKRLVLFANVKGGFGTTNPKTIAGLTVDGEYEQIRVRYDLMPITFSLGILF